MVSPEFNSEQKRLLDDVKSLLHREREQRSERERSAFLAAVNRRITEPERLPEAREARRLDILKPRKRWLLLAAGVMTVLVAAMTMMSNLLSPSTPSAEQAAKTRAARLAAARIALPAPANGLLIHSPSILASAEGETMVLFTYEHYGERCLWLYPKSQIQLGEDAEADRNFADRRKWYATVADGKVQVPARALDPDFSTGEDLVLLKIGNHFEIWTASGLTRYFAKSG